MAIVKSKLIKQLSRSYPNFLKKDLEKFTDIILKEIKTTLRRGERVELRGFGIFSTNKQNWTTLPEFYRQIDEKRNKHESDEKKMKLLNPEGFAAIKYYKKKGP